MWSRLKRPGRSLIEYFLCFWLKGKIPVSILRNEMMPAGTIRAAKLIELEALRFFVLICVFFFSSRFGPAAEFITRLFWIEPRFALNLKK